MAEAEQITVQNQEGEEENLCLNNAESLQSSDVIQQSKQQKPQQQWLFPHIFQSIENYIESHNCIKCLLFFVVILLIIALQQQKIYLVKKQRTFQFFIQKIQKESIQQSQSKRPDLAEIKDQEKQFEQKDKIQLNTQKDYKIHQQTHRIHQKNENISFKGQSPNASIKSKQINISNIIATHSEKNYLSNEGIGLQKIVMAAQRRSLKDQDIFRETQLANSERRYYQENYQIQLYQELPFCVVIPSYNNAAGNKHISNIRSVVMQEYSNYHIVFINDASNDSTAFDVQHFLLAQDKILPEKYVIITNQNNKGSLANIRMAAYQFCNPEEIFMIIDGDDELIGRQVLKLYNAVYQQTGTWVLYSNFLTPSGKTGYSKPYPESIMQDNSYRKYPFVISHLRSFYTQLLRNIKQEDLKDATGNYFKAANDVAIYIPILQMAHKKVVYLPQLTYLYNDDTGTNNHQLKLTEQKRNARFIRKFKQYQPIISINTTLKQSDGLFESEKQWFAQVLKIQSQTEHLGKVSESLAPQT